MGIKKFFIIGLAVVGLLWAGSANATLIGGFSVDPGNSWAVSWTDTTGEASFDKTEFFIMTDPYKFDQAASTNLAGWNGYLVNPTYSYIEGPDATSDKTLNLYFAGFLPGGGVKVDILVWNDTNLVAGQSWRWTDLPNQGGWEVFSPNPTSYNTRRTAVPEGGSILAMLGIGMMIVRSLRRWWLI